MMVTTYQRTRDDWGGAEANSCKPQALTLGQTGTIPATATESLKPKTQRSDSFTNTGTKPGHLDSDRQSSQVLKNTFSTVPKLKGILSLGKGTQLGPKAPEKAY